MWPYLQFPADLVTFTEEILNGKFYLLCSDFTFMRTWCSAIFHISFCHIIYQILLEKLPRSWDFQNIYGIENGVDIFFSIGVFFHDHSGITRLQGKGKGISITPHYHFHPLRRHLDISRAITAGSLPLHIGSSWTRNGNLWFPSASR